MDTSLDQTILRESKMSTQVTSGLQYVLKRLISHLISLSILIVFSSQASPLLAQEWQSLFNGKDLTGWRAHLYPEAWSVVDGTLKAQTKTTTSHLFYVGEKPEGEFVPFTNFVLELTAKCEPNSNSGIFFHTDYAVPKGLKHLSHGYEVQLNSSEKEKSKTGGLYGIVDLAESPVDESKWFQIRLTVNGKHIVVQIDDKTVIDYTEPDDPPRTPRYAGRRINPMGGAIVLQAHDAQSTFYFKDIRIKRLP